MSSEFDKVQFQTKKSRFPIHTPNYMQIECAIVKTFSK